MSRAKKDSDNLETPDVKYAVEPKFVLNATKGLKTIGDSTKNYKERQRERFFTEFSLDLKRKDVNLLKDNYEEQKRQLEEEEHDLEKKIQDFKKLLADSETLTERAVKTAEDELNTKLALEDEVQTVKNHIEELNGDNLAKQNELALLETYKDFLNAYSPEGEGDENDSIYFEKPEDVLRKFWGQENYCLELMKQCELLEHQMDQLGEGINTTKTKLEENLQEFKHKCHKVQEKICQQQSKLKDVNKNIAAQEEKRSNPNLFMNRFEPHINRCYRNVYNKNTNVKQTNLQMMMHLEQKLYNLFDEMKMFTPSTLNKAAKAKLKEEMRHQQELRLEALKTR